MMRPIANPTCMDSSVRALRDAILAFRALLGLENSDAERQCEDRQTQRRASAPAPPRVRPARRADAGASTQIVEEHVQRVGPAAAAAQTAVQRSHRGGVDSEESAA